MPDSIVIRWSNEIVDSVSVSNWGEADGVLNDCITNADDIDAVLIYQGEDYIEYSHANLLSMRYSDKDA